MTTTLLRTRPCPDTEHLARKVARAIGCFEHALLDRVPRSVTIVASGDRLVVSLHESFSPLERGLAANGRGCCRIEDFHHDIFDSSREALVEHVRSSTGVALDAGIVHVDAATGSILKTFTTDPAVELFLLGEGLPALGVPVNAHLHAHGAAGTGAVRS
ncbi:MAG: Na-translocating system protein MpsC family protein [Planctomycetia bacterium]